MDIFGLRIFVEVQYDIFKILSPKNICRSLPSIALAPKKVVVGFSQRGAIPGIIIIIKFLDFLETFLNF